MSQFIRIAQRNKDAGAPFLEPLDVDRRARRNYNFAAHLRLGYESIEIIVVDRRIDPRIEVREVRRRLIEQQPLDVLARAVQSGNRLFDEWNDRPSAKAGDGVWSAAVLRGGRRRGRRSTPISILDR